MSDELVTREKILAAVAGGASYAQIVKDIKTEAAATTKPRKSTIAKRKAALAEAIANSDRKVLAKLRTSMRKYVTDMAEVQMDHPRELTRAEAHELMTEHSSFQEINEFLQTRRETIKALVFTAIEERLRAKGIDDPEAHNGAIYVPTLGKVFKKEGAGYQPPTIDIRGLSKLLGTDAKAIFTERVIPAQTVTELDEEALGKLIMEKPEVLEHLRNSLIPGAAKSARFIVRDYDPNAPEAE